MILAICSRIKPVSDCAMTGLHLCVIRISAVLAAGHCSFGSRMFNHDRW